ncbi:MAG: helix-turn-helix domain-containing protein [Fusobacteriaceae bacterium]
MKYNLAYKYRIYPDEERSILIQKTFCCTRFVYNKILAKVKEIFEAEGKNKIITPATLKPEFQFLKESELMVILFLN